MVKKQPIGPHQEKWLKALESGDYEQGRNVLATLDRETGKVAYCCLGVGCEVAGIKRTKRPDKDGIFRYAAPPQNGLTSRYTEKAIAPPKLVEWLALYDENGTRGVSVIAPSLTNLNDEGVPFKEIAKTIRKNPGDWFAEPK